MAESKSAEEQPKKEVARQLVTPKRKYFFPESGQVLEAASLESATKQHAKQSKEGDQEK